MWHGPSTKLRWITSRILWSWSLHMLQMSLLGWGLQLKRQNYNWFICLWVICIDTPCSCGAVKYPCNQRADYVTSSHNSYQSYSPCCMWPQWRYFSINRAKFHYSDTQNQRGAKLSNILYYWVVLYLFWPKFLQAIFCYCSYTWAVQLITVFHLEVSFTCWFRVPVVYLGILFGGWGSTNLVEDRKNGNLGAVAP